MTKDISSMDLYYLTKELKILENQRIDNFYYENNIFYIKIYISQIGNKFLTSQVSKYIYIGDQKDESSIPDNFITFLRKYLKNGYIREIKQIESERILEIKIEKIITEKLETFYLIIELFSNGNIILCDNNYTIRNAIIKKKYKDRKVMVKDQYELPPQKELSITNLNENLFKTLLKQSDLTIVKFLAIKLGTGGKFAEEICSIANINKNQPTTSLNQNEITQIISNIKTIINKPISAFTIHKDNKITDFIPFEFQSVTNNKKPQKTFNNAIKLYYKQNNIQIDKTELKLQKQLIQLQKRLELQKEQKEQILKDYEKYNEIGNKIYENYTTIENLLTSINSTAKEKGWNYIIQTIKKTPQLQKIIKTLNYKNNEITLNL